jgi:hypothetical protein
VDNPIEFQRYHYLIHQHLKLLGFVKKYFLVLTKTQ